MISFKQYRQLNEALLGSPLTLGLSQPTKIGNLISRWDEGSKRMKMMLGDMEGGDEGGGDLPPPMPKKKGPPMPPMGKGKGHLPPPGDDEDVDDDEDMDDADDDQDADDDDMGGDDDDAGHDDDGGEGGGDDLGGAGDGVQDDVPAPPMKKKMPPAGGLAAQAKGIADGAKMMHKGAAKMAKHMAAEATEEEEHDDEHCCKKCSKKMKKKMTKEDVEFLESLKRQTGQTYFKLDAKGCPLEEDAVIPPSNPNAGLEDDDDEPRPGDVGFAPQGRVGGLGSFEEWSSKYRR